VSDRVSAATALKNWITVLLLALATLATSPALAGRLALVIGNRDYQVGPLKNPVNDAQAMAAELGSLGFQVTLVRNLRRDDIARTVDAFSRRVKPGDDVVFFYAGHGVQVKGVNYLPAVDASIRVEGDVPLNSLNLSELLDRLDEAKAGVKLLLLDACRDNPYANANRSGTRGLARPQGAPAGTLMHFATRPGGVAADGDGSNGRYTAELLKHMRTPGLQVELMLKRVASGVRQASAGEQVPWSEGSLDGDFYFAMAAPGAVPPAARVPVPDPGPAPAGGGLAIVPFAGDSQIAATVTRAIGRNLERSGRVPLTVHTVSAGDERSTPDLPALAARGAAHVLAGSVTPLPDGRLDIRYRLWRTRDGQIVLGLSKVVLPADIRLGANRMSDEIHLGITGVASQFAQRVAKVVVLGTSHVLTISDGDGSNTQQALRSPKPVGLPLWSANRSQLMYASLESGSPAFYLQELSSGQRRVLPQSPALAEACQKELRLIESGPEALREDWRGDDWQVNANSPCLPAMTTAFNTP
jgi:hypothetical protein